jgi:hypothetical protein
VQCIHSSFSAEPTLSKSVIIRVGQNCHPKIQKTRYRIVSLFRILDVHQYRRSTGEVQATVFLFFLGKVKLPRDFPKHCTFKTMFLRSLCEFSSDWTETYTTVGNYKRKMSSLVRSDCYSIVSYGLRNFYRFAPLAK